MAKLPDGQLDPLTVVVEKVLAQASDLPADQIMLVGAWCRDIMHLSLGHAFPTKRSNDVDLALGLRSWTTFEPLAEAFPRAGDSGIRFLIEGVKVDLMPFGTVEVPAGVVVPPTRDDELSVWGFEEIHHAATLYGSATRSSYVFPQFRAMPPPSSQRGWIDPSGGKRRTRTILL